MSIMNRHDDLTHDELLDAYAEAVILAGLANADEDRKRRRAANAASHPEAFRRHSAAFALRRSAEREATEAGRVADLAKLDLVAVIKALGGAVLVGQTVTTVTASERDGSARLSCLPVRRPVAALA